MRQIEHLLKQACHEKQKDTEHHHTCIEELEAKLQAQEHLSDLSKRRVLEIETELYQVKRLYESLQKEVQLAKKKSEQAF